MFVSLHDGTRAKATIVHNHDSADLAILKSAIHTERYFDLSSSTLSDGFDAGDEALAIGHPRGLSFTATTGIISESARRLPDGVFVQTDVAINPGSSGGPLFDVEGRLIGLNTRMITESQGLGFAIPARQVFKYWQDFVRLYSSGTISVPSDEQLSKAEQSLTPRQVIESAAELADIALEFQARESDSQFEWRWNAVTEADNTFMVCIDEHSFFLVSYIAELEYPPDPHLLHLLLRWQEDMTGLIRFTIDDDNNLFLQGTREFTDLDVSEAAMSIARMAAAVDTYENEIIKWLSEQ